MTESEFVVLTTFNNVIEGLTKKTKMASINSSTRSKRLWMVQNSDFQYTESFGE